MSDAPESPRGDRRHRPGERRTSAEPLVASWHPERVKAEEKPRARRMSWHVYVIPLLIVATVLVLVNIGHWDTASGSGGFGVGSPQDATALGQPAATEGGATSVDPNSGTAALPPGPNVPQAGAGTWHVVPGNGPIVGKGQRLYHYQVAVEDGIDPAAYDGDDAFAHDVDATLADPRGWLAAGTIALQRVDAGYQNPDFIVSLTTPNTDHRPDLCGFQIGYEASCWRPSSHRVVINLARWVRGALAFEGELGLYRQYAINHEVGHVFGNLHVGCATSGGLAPVMMQQSFGVSDDYVYQLNQADPVNKTRVPRDGKVCKPNAWPYPDGPGNSPDMPPG